MLSNYLHATNGIYNSKWPTIYYFILRNRGDTVVILGSCAGLNMGAWMNYQLGIIRGPPLDPPYPVIWPSLGMLGLSFLRLSIGLVIVYSTKVILKSAASLILRGLIRNKTMSYVVSCKQHIMHTSCFQDKQ